MWRDRLQDRLRLSLAPLRAAGRSWRAYRHDDRTRCCQLAESALAPTFAISSTSVGPAVLVQTPCVARSIVRSESKRARASHCRTTVHLQTTASLAERS